MGLVPSPSKVKSLSGQIMLDQPDPELRANCFGVLFDKAPTYQEINSGTPSLASCVALNEVFMQDQGMLAAGHGFEP